MSLITIIGAGMMGTALCWPLSDNGHSIRLVGTHLDDEIISSIQLTGVHPKLMRQIPNGVTAYTHIDIPKALTGADVVVCGVSSFGVHWFADTVGPLLNPVIPIIAVTKGLEDCFNGSLYIFPHVIRQRLPENIRLVVNFNAIAGPCTSHELAARRQTCVVFTGENLGKLQFLRTIFHTSYYHVWTSTDVIGVEVCAALKNAYALGVGISIGLMEQAGMDGLAWAYNPQAALFAQSCREMRCLLKVLGGDEENASWLPGIGDLYVTIYGGRTVKLGRLLGMGLSYVEARKSLGNETLESVQIITCMGRALPKLADQGLVRLEDFPLLLHLDQVINRGFPINLPWDSFFTV
jgi:glycerol-3-phosphate dehydrogenase (NAD(P)+)